MENSENEIQLYADQMQHWFNEHATTGRHIETTITYHEEMAQSNRQQLVLHHKRMDLAKNEYNAWAEAIGMPLRIDL